MRIGFLGNSNNYPFRLAHTLHELGHEVIFFVDRPRNEPRHRPEFHYSDIPYPYPDWIREIKPVNLKRVLLASVTLKKVIGTLNECNGVILNGLALGLGRLIDRPIIGILTGSDLDVYANPALVESLASVPERLDKVPGYIHLKKILFSRLVKLQREGIARCHLVEYAIPGLLPHGDALLDDIGVKPEKRVSFMLTDTEHLPIPSQREDGVFRIFCATRLQWKRAETGANVSPLDMKGTDTLFQGLRAFIEHAHIPVEIHLIRLGTDAEHAVRLVTDLGLDPYVRWHSELTQNEFLGEMAQADVILENFGRSSCIGMAGRDAIAMGKPLVAWAHSDIFKSVLGEPLPIYEALSATEISSALSLIASDKEGAARHAVQARAFAERWFSPRRAAERCVQAFAAA